MACLTAVSILSLLQKKPRKILKHLSEIDTAAGLQNCFTLSRFMKGPQHSLHVTCTGKEIAHVATTILRKSFVLSVGTKF